MAEIGDVTGVIAALGGTIAAVFGAVQWFDTRNVRAREAQDRTEIIAGEWSPGGILVTITYDPEHRHDGVVATVALRSPRGARLGRTSYAASNLGGQQAVPIDLSSTAATQITQDMWRGVAFRRGEIDIPDHLTAVVVVAGDPQPKSARITVKLTEKSSGRRLYRRTLTVAPAPH